MTVATLRAYLRGFHHQRMQNARALQTISQCFRTFMSLQAEHAVDPGQPTPETHPEVLSEGEITVQIHSSEYSLRRKKLMKLLPENSLVIVGSASIQQMTDVVPYPFRQNADYLYFTGCQQPGGIAVLSGHSDFCMFVPDSDPMDIVWNGPQADKVAACNIFGASHAYSTRQLPEILSSMLHQTDTIFYDGFSLGPGFWRLPVIQRAISGKRVQNVHKFTHLVRWVKSQAEIDLMRQSAGIASQAFLQTMMMSKNWPHEHILAATIEYECKIRGAQRMAFPPVVGGGKNGTIIHYSRNDQQIQEGNMVLVDAGCEFHGYVSDVTRSWPPSGKFSQAQRGIYDAVLETSRECISLCRPGITLNEIHRHSVQILSEKILNLGILKDVKENFFVLNPTAIGHYLGMDVHDCALVSKNQPLQHGVVITIEPGLYIPCRGDIPSKYQGIGVRIEDEVLITEAGCEVLTASIPKEVEEIEALLQRSTVPTHPLSRVPFIKANPRLQRQ